MSTESVLAALSERGIVLIADGPNLRFHPRDRMTPELLQEVRAHKAALLVLARRNGGDGDETPKNHEHDGGFVASGSQITSAQPADALGQELVPLQCHLPESETEQGYWVDITAADYQYLTGPHIFPKSRCPWCGGYLVHSRACKELTAAWEPTLPYGKHRGRRVRDVPVEYLKWMLGSRHTLSPDLRTMIERRVAGGRMETGHAG